MPTPQFSVVVLFSVLKVFSAEETSNARLFEFTAAAALAERMLSTSTAPTHVPAVSYSTKSCSQLRWSSNGAATFGSTSVCGSTPKNESGGCYKSLTWPESRDICEGLGARMCSADEFYLYGEASNTGCGYNHVLLWSSKSCSDGYFQAPGSIASVSFYVPFNVTCKTTSNTLPVKCCADDHPSPSPTPVPTHAPTPWPSPEPTPEPTQVFAFDPTFA